MDHEVQDDVDVERARGEDGQPVRLKEHWPGEAAERGIDGRIEALEMPGSKDAAVAARRRKQPIGFGERGGEGLFDEQIEAGLKQLAGDGGMRDGRHTNGRGMETEICREKLIDGRKARDRVLGDGGGAGDRVGFDNGGQHHRSRVRAGSEEASA